DVRSGEHAVGTDVGAGDILDAFLLVIADKVGDVYARIFKPAANGNLFALNVSAENDLVCAKRLDPTCHKVGRLDRNTPEVYLAHTGVEELMNFRFGL